MASVYNTEPPTKGKVRNQPSVLLLCSQGNAWLSATAWWVPQVVIKTTMGDVDVELWPKEAPKVWPYGSDCAQLWEFLQAFMWPWLMAG